MTPGLLRKNQPGVVERATRVRSQPAKEGRLRAQLKRRAKLSALAAQMAEQVNGFGSCKLFSDES